MTHFAAASDVVAGFMIHGFDRLAYNAAESQTASLIEDGIRLARLVAAVESRRRRMP